MGAVTKNHMEVGGDKWVVGGELALTAEAVITQDGEPVVLEGGVIPDAAVTRAKLATAVTDELDGKLTASQAAAVDDSEATTIAGLKDDFNAVLAALRTAGIMAEPGE